MSIRPTNLFSAFLPLLLLVNLNFADDVVRKTPSADLQLLKTAKIHEAFAAPHVFHTDAPIPASKAPPAELVEVKPAIDANLKHQAVWVPGYWEWDWESDKFIWTTGIWRFPPPGHRWIAGRWARHQDGYVRVRGSWLPGKIERIVYVSTPPKYKGRFPLAASIDQHEFWVPGNWVPAAEGKFTWREPFVARRIEKWEWIPAQYCWSPEGWLFVDGYWDFPVQARGQAFASLLLTNPVYEADKTRLEAFSPIPNDAIRESSSGEFVYSVEAFPEKYEFVGIAQQELNLPEPPVVVERVLTQSPNGVIRGVVHRGTLTPAGIEVELIGHSVVTQTDEQGRFEFSNVPYGTHYVRAAGPVQNHVKRAYGRVVVSEPVVETDFELR